MFRTNHRASAKPDGSSRFLIRKGSRELQMVGILSHCRSSLCLSLTSHVATGRVLNRVHTDSDDSDGVSVLTSVAEYFFLTDSISTV